MLHRAASLLDMKTTELYSLKEHGGFTCDVMCTGYDIFTICDGKMGIFVHVDIVGMEKLFGDGSSSCVGNEICCRESTVFT